jgi:predicted phosphodiesterase
MTFTLKVYHYPVAFVWSSITLLFMRIAIISDIHSNLQALQRAFEIIDIKEIDLVYCLGDIVGYGAEPNECIAMLRDRKVLCIAGNHDKAALDTSRAEHLNRYARTAIEWTARQLIPENIEFLSHLPYTLVAHHSTFVHASPGKPEEWNYIITGYDAQEYFEFFTTPLCWVGHSHISGVYCEDVSSSEVERGKRYIINVGSVGQPRNRDRRLSFGIFDDDRWEYEHVVAEYDAGLAREKIIEAGLPPYLGDRLLAGV